MPLSWVSTIFRRPRGGLPLASGHAQQYTQINVPSVVPENLVKSEQTRCNVGDFLCFFFTLFLLGEKIPPSGWQFWPQVFQVFLLVCWLLNRAGHHFELCQATLSRPTRCKLAVLDETTNLRNWQLFWI